MEEEGKKENTIKKEIWGERRRLFQKRLIGWGEGLGVVKAIGVKEC